jgi:hypothetical protein
MIEQAPCRGATVQRCGAARDRREAIALETEIAQSLLARRSTRERFALAG